MNCKQENKTLAEELKAKLNSPDYVAIPEILEHGDRYGSMLTWLWGKKEGWISDDEREKGDKIIYEHQLEPTDWEEIVNLIEKRNEEKKQAFEQKWAQIQEKLNNTPGLYYFWGRSRKEEKADCWVEWKGMRGFTNFFGKENGRTHYLNITEDHPILDNFSFEKGFYLIDTDVPIEKNSPDYWCSGGEDNPHNFHKWAELENEITITPENGEKLVAKKANRKQNASNKKTTEAAGSAKSNLTAAKSKSTTPEAKNNLTAQGQNPADNKQLTQILQEIQELKAKIAELEQTKTNSPQVQKLNQQLQALEAQKQTLTPSPNSNNSSSKLANDNNPTNQASPSIALYLIGGLVIFGISALTIGYFLGKKRKKSS